MRFSKKVSGTHMFWYEILKHSYMKYVSESFFGYEYFFFTFSLFFLYTCSDDGGCDSDGNENSGGVVQKGV